MISNKSDLSAWIVPLVPPLLTLFDMFIIKFEKEASSGQFEWVSIDLKTRHNGAGLVLWRRDVGDGSGLVVLHETGPTTQARVAGPTLEARLSELPT